MKYSIFAVVALSLLTSNAFAGEKTFWKNEGKYELVFSSLDQKPKVIDHGKIELRFDLQDGASDVCVLETRHETAECRIGYYRSSHFALNVDKSQLLRLVLGSRALKPHYKANLKRLLGGEGDFSCKRISAERKFGYTCTVHFNDSEPENIELKLELPENKPLHGGE